MAFGLEEEALDDADRCAVNAFPVEYDRLTQAEVETARSEAGPPANLPRDPRLAGGRNDQVLDLARAGRLHRSSGEREGDDKLTRWAGLPERRVRIPVAPARIPSQLVDLAL